MQTNVLLWPLLLLTLPLQAERPALEIGVAHPAPITDLQDTTSFEGDLPRRARLGFTTGVQGPGGLYDGARLEVRSVEPGSPAGRAGLVEGDVIASVNEETTPSALRAFEMLGNLPGGTTAVLQVTRGERRHVVRFVPEPEPLEGLEGVHTTYGVLTMDDGTPLRTLLTRPLNAERDRLPAVLLSDWTSCDSVEVPRTRNRGWINLVRGIVERSGMIVLRVDKPGTGDSLGSCSELDFDETVAYQRKALERLTARPDVDQARVFVLGESVGSYMAPLVAQGQDVAGIVVYGGGASTWIERMMTFERKQRELRDRPLETVDREMKRVGEFLHHYLVEARSLDEIFADHPGLRDVWTDDISFNSSTRHYGRPISFHQQAQRHDYARAWVEAGAPALVLFGEYDQFESVEGARTIVRAVNRARPGDATLVIYQGMNHQLELYDSPEAAMAGTATPVVGAEPVVEDILEWLRRRVESL